MTAAFTSLGNLSIDDLVFVDGTTQWAVPGGNAVYAALGMAIWGERPPSHRALRSGLSRRQKLEARLDMSTCPRIPVTLRDWGLYEEDGSRQFVFRSTTREWDDFSPRPSDVRGPRSCGSSRAAAMGAPRRPCRRPARGRRKSHFHRPRRSQAAVGADEAVAELIRSVDLFMPSRQDGRAIFPDASPADTVRRFRDMAPNTALIVLKCGADGSIAHAAGSRDLIIAARLPRRRRRCDRSRRQLLRRRARWLRAHRRILSRRCFTAPSRLPFASRRWGARVC